MRHIRMRIGTRFQSYMRYASSIATCTMVCLKLTSNLQVPGADPDAEVEGCVKPVGF